MARRRALVTVPCLEQHPNAGEILGVLARLPHITDADLPKLAAGWTNTVYLADARSKALQPDAPLVLEVLAAFEAVQSLFGEDVSGEPDYVTVDPEVTTVALKAIRDAIAAAYARPILGRPEHAALMRAWRTVYPTDDIEEPDLGARGADVKALLEAMPRLAARCHDTAAASEFSALLRGSSRLDERVREAARDETWRAAVLTSRRRVWGLVRRSAAEGLGRYCVACRHRSHGDETARVLALCLDAACALLVADAVDDTLIDVLTLPVQLLIPTQRPPADA